MRECRRGPVGRTRQAGRHGRPRAHHKSPCRRSQIKLSVRLDHLNKVESGASKYASFEMGRS
jgi:hypothetical protein